MNFLEQFNGCLERVQSAVNAPDRLRRVLVLCYQSQTKLREALANGDGQGAERVLNAFQKAMEDRAEEWRIPGNPFSGKK